MDHALSICLRRGSMINPQNNFKIVYLLFTYIEYGEESIHKYIMKSIIYKMKAKTFSVNISLQYIRQKFS